MASNSLSDQHDLDLGCVCDGSPDLVGRPRGQSVTKCERNAKPIAERKTSFGGYCPEPSCNLCQSFVDRDKLDGKRIEHGIDIALGHAEPNKVADDFSDKNLGSNEATSTNLHH
jgi:hypothetical protein